jgi:CBS domain containing-hemolysin-like protein
VLTGLGLLAMVALIATNGLFVAAEFGLTTVDRSRLRRLAASGDQRAGGVLAAVQELSLQLSGAQLGITLTSLLLGLVAEPVLARLLDVPLQALGLPDAVADAGAVVLALLLATVVQMLFGELVPQDLAIARPLGTALAITPLQRGFTRLCRPVIALCNETANAIVRGLGAEPQEELRSARTPGELDSLIGASAEEGTLNREIAALLRRSLTFGDKTAGSVLTPRLQVVAVRADQTAAELLDLARRSGHSRFPVHDGALDEVTGLVHVKHAFAVPLGARERTRVAEIMVEPVSVAESLHCDDLLTRLRRGGLQLAVVVDEYGGTAGVVTLEDLVEELVGQVRDEHDRPEVPAVVALSDGGRAASGLVRRDELTEQLGLVPPEGVYETLAGLVVDRLGRLPQTGDVVEVDGWTLGVMRMDGYRIDRIHVRRPDRRPDQRQG